MPKISYLNNYQKEIEWVISEEKSQYSIARLSPSPCGSCGERIMIVIDGIDTCVNCGKLIRN